jgi:DNA-binding MarR family transcriptional regulator
MNTHDPRREGQPDNLRIQPDGRTINPYHIRVITALRQIMQKIDLHSRRLMKNHDTTIPQAVCLYHLYEKGVTTAALLSRQVHLSASTLVGVLDRLEEKKLISRSRDKDDRRSVMIDVTDKGREFVRETPYLLHNRFSQALSKLPLEEQQMIAAGLETLVQLFEEND